MPLQFLGFLAIILTAPALWADGDKATELALRNRVAEESRVPRRIVAGFRLTQLSTVKEINGLLLSPEHDLEFPNLLDKFVKVVATPDGQDLVKMRFIYQDLLDQYFKARAEAIRSGEIHDLEIIRQLDSAIAELIVLDIRRLSRKRETQDLLLLGNTLIRIREKWNQEIPEDDSESMRREISFLTRRAILEATSAQLIYNVIVDRTYWPGISLTQRFERHISDLSSSLLNGSSSEFLQRLAGEAAEFFLIPDAYYKIVVGLLPKDRFHVRKNLNLPNEHRQHLIDQFFKKDKLGRHEFITNIGHQRLFFNLMQIANRPLAVSKAQKIEELQFLSMIEMNEALRGKFARHFQVLIRELMKEELDLIELQTLFDILDRFNLEEFNPIRAELSDYAIKAKKIPNAWYIGITRRHHPEAKVENIHNSASVGALHLSDLARSRPSFDQLQYALNALNRLRRADRSLTRNDESFEETVSGLAGLNTISEILEISSYMIDDLEKIFPMHNITIRSYSAAKFDKRRLEIRDRYLNVNNSREQIQIARDARDLYIEIRDILVNATYSDLGYCKSRILSMLR